MTHPAWYTEPTDECCGHCGKRNLTRYEVQDGQRCDGCRAAGMPPACRCGGGVVGCQDGMHVYRERITTANGATDEVLVARRERTEQGSLRLERCPVQLEHWRARRGRMLARIEAGERRPIGLR